MPKTKLQKQAAVKEFSVKVNKAKAMFVVAPKAINPNEAADLKIKLAEVGGEYHLVKNSLFKKALEEVGLTTNDEFAVGQNAIIFVGDQSPEAAKILKKFAKDSEKVEFKGGYLEGKLISKDDVISLAELPSREVMLGQVLATMNAPVTGFVRVLAGNVRSIITLIDAYKNSKS